MGAFSRLGRLGSITPYGIVRYGMLCVYVSICIKRIWERSRAFWSVLLETFRERSNAFRVFWEHMGALGRLGRLVNIIPYVWYGMVA